MNKVNINLFHGRNTVDEELEDWGFEGPILKDVGFAFTYGLLKIFNVNYDGSFGDMIFLPVVEGMVKLGGKYYGDFEILTSDDEAIVRDADRERLTFLQLKAIVEAETPEPKKPTLKWSDEDIVRFGEEYRIAYEKEHVGSAVAFLDTFS